MTHKDIAVSESPTEVPLVGDYWISIHPVKPYLLEFSESLCFFSLVVM
jgi:hypothetical protein